MKRFVIFMFFVSGLAVAGNSQGNYKNAIGGRLGTTYYDVLSFSYKSFISRAGALELNAGFGAKGYGSHNTSSLTGAITYQHHFEIRPAPGLNWYVGGGLTIFNTFSKKNDYRGFGFGLYPTGGVEYTFGNIPLNVSADIRPTVHAAGPGVYNSYNGNFGIAARYTLGR